MSFCQPLGRIDKVQGKYYTRGMKYRIFVLLSIVLVCAAACALGLGLAACNKVVVRDVTIATSPTKTNYYIGDELNLAGCTLHVVYSNGQVKTVDAAPEMASPFAAAELGPETITLRYTEGAKNFVLPLTLHIVARPPMRLEVETLPTVDTYVVGQTVDIKGLKVRVYYTETDVRIVDASVLEYTPVVATLSTATVRVGYERKWLDVPITVEPVRHIGLTATVVESETLWQYSILYGYQLAYYYVNNDESLSPTDYVQATEVGSRLMAAGPLTLHLAKTDEESGATYQGTATVEVMPNALEGVRVTAAKYAYHVGDAYTTAGLKMDLEFAHSQWRDYDYATGPIAGIATTMAAGTVLDTAGVQEVGFTLDDTPLLGTYRVCVDTVAVVRLQATQEQPLRTYTEGVVAHPDNLVLYAVSSDDSRVQIWNRNNARVEGVTLSAPLVLGDTRAYVYYDGLSYAFEVVVTPRPDEE